MRRLCGFVKLILAKANDKRQDTLRWECSTRLRKVCVEREWNLDKLHQGGMCISEYELGDALPQLGIDASHGE